MDNNTPIFENVLLVAGTGRNSGKTTFVTTICNRFSAALKPVCIKISNHFHEQPGAICLLAEPNFRIFEETVVTSDKDTARMLAAGASRVFFIEAEEAHTYDAFLKVVSMLPAQTPIICESGGLRNYLVPAVFIMLHTKGTEAKPSAQKLIPLADKLLESELGKLLILENIVSFENKKWILRK